MSTSNTETTPNEKSQYVILSHHLFSAQKGTLALRDGYLSFTDNEGQRLINVSLNDILKYNQYYRSLKLYTPTARYKFVFIPPDEKKLLMDTLTDTYYAIMAPLWTEYWKSYVSKSGIMGWVRILKKRGVPNGRRNYFAYSLLVVIFPVLIFTSLALYGNLAGINAASVPRSYTELLVELMIVVACFAGFAYVIKTIRKNG